MLNLVVGATGPVGLGREICHRLVKKGAAVRALVRPTADPARVRELSDLGVELVEGDLKDRASLAAVCEGVTAVLTTATTTLSRQPGDTIESVDLNGYRNLIAAAKRAGVEQFIYTSYSRNTNVPCPLTSAKRTIEALVADVGWAYTVLRPTHFTEIWLGPALGFDLANAKARVYGSGQGKISWIATGDVAEFAVASLGNPAARNTILELGGPDALSQLEVIRLCEELGGRRFEIERVPEATLQAQLATETDPLQLSFAALKLVCVYGDLIDMSETLKAFPVPLMSVRDYVQRLLS
jgi:uncharacterized protein YbjT (DUF2867 family)